MMLADVSDPFHAPARKVRDGWLEAGGKLLTTDYVVDETLTLLRFRLSLDQAEVWWSHVTSSTRVRIVAIEASHAARAREWFFGWRDKDFSFTDCTSFVVMREKRLKRALATDKRFTQAGFERLPRVK
jgi:hypothetical protein